MFERFTERARQVVVLALEEARGLGHPSIGTEHVLLGLSRAEGGLAARVLACLDVTAERVRDEVARSVGGGEGMTSGEIPLAPSAQRVLEAAAGEAVELGHDYVGTEHILLAVTNEAAAARILASLGADAQRVRDEVMVGMRKVDPTSQRQGVVRIREGFTVQVHWHRFSAEWQPDPRAPAESFRTERGPGWNDVEDAVAWARRRAPIVYVRLGAGWRDWYDAGERDGHADPATRRWPGAPRRRAAKCVPEYAGVVYVGEEFPDFLPTGRFDAVWTDAQERLLGREEGLAEVDAAIEWGRARAPVVLVAEAPNRWSGFPTYDIRSAGAEDPAGEPLERIRAPADDGELLWELTTQVTAASLSAAEHASRLEQALSATPTVLIARCSPATSRPTGSAKVDVVVRVSATTRAQAEATAYGAVSSAQVKMTGERIFLAGTALRVLQD